MILRAAKSSESPQRLSPLVETVAFVWYGVAAVIVATVLYISFHFIPLIKKDLIILEQGYKADAQLLDEERGLLQHMQDNRALFLRALLHSNGSADRKSDLESLHELDRTIVSTQDSLGAGSQSQEASLRAIRESWQSYAAARDKLLARGATSAFREDQFDLGDRLFAAAQNDVQTAAATLRASAAGKIALVAHELHAFITEIIILVVGKVVALGLLIWLDQRRIRLESQLKRTTRELRSSEYRFKGAYESATVGMGMFSLDGTVLSANKKAAEILGCEIDDLIGTKVSDFMAPECRDDHQQKMLSIPRGAIPSYHTERRVLRKDGTSAWVRNSVTLLQSEGEEPHYFSISEEITHQKEANDRLAYLANYDPITNLPNRRYFDELLAAALQPSAGFMDCVAILYLEIDSFDFLKGTFGRTVADEVLAEVGVSLAAFRRPDEVVARLDDYVFVLMLKAAPYDESSLARGNELRDLFHGTNALGKHRIPLSASVGIAYSNNGALGASLRSPSAVSNGSSSEAESLLKYARAAMLEARSRGGDSIYLADPALQERAAQRHRIELALLRGLREDEFRVVFQPQFQVSTGKLVRFEALCRWTSGELGIIPPDRFIPIAEQTGLIMEIGRRVLLEALIQAQTWSESGHRIGVAVNISPMQFMRPDFTQHIADVLAATKFPPDLLELEITEGIFIRDLNLAVARIRELQRLGLSIALDDFGTGYSSLSYLQRMPIDAVKLDRSFVSDLTTDPATVSMVRSVLAMAEALKLRVVTEGVETEEQLDILRTLGCDEAQGYLLGRPESAEMALQRVMGYSADSTTNIIRFVS